MVARYGVVISRWWSHFCRSEKASYFLLLSTIKVTLADKVVQSTKLCVILHVKLKKLPVHAVFPWFLILGKIQVGDPVWWRHRPPAAPPPLKYTSSCWEDQRLSSESKIVSKYCNISTTTPNPPPPLVPRRGVWICVYVRELSGLLLCRDGLFYQITRARFAFARWQLLYGFRHKAQFFYNQFIIVNQSCLSVVNLISNGNLFTSTVSLF